MPFIDASWSTPKGDLGAADYCKVCLIDENPSGEEKIKAKCKLPVRSRPGGAYNKNAIRNAMGRIFQVKGVGGEAKRKAARRLVRLAREAKIEVGESVLRLAGMRKN